MQNDDFIYFKHEVFNQEECQNIINKMEETIALDLGLNHDAVHQGSELMPEGALGRDDIQIYLPRRLPEVYGQVMIKLYECWGEYTKKYPALKNGGPIFFDDFKAQKTPRNSIGFAKFHAEQGAGPSAGRAVVWTIYLNDVTEGGETEFPYQGKKIPPREGTLVFFPASFTHTHRGNPPYSNDKYMLTGWVSFMSEMDATEYFRGN